MDIRYYFYTMNNVFGGALRRYLLMFCLLTSILQAKVYDCFLFFNEYEVLEIRLNELYDVVDHFVLVEAAETFRGQPKPFYYEQEKERFARFADKIIHIKVDPYHAPNAWIREFHQRNQIGRGLKGCRSDDLVIIADVDEIIPSVMLPQLKELVRHHQIVGVRTRLFQYYLNREVCPNQSYCWLRVAVTNGRYMREHSAQVARETVWWPTDPPLIVDGGWHFSSMGGYDRCRRKWDSYSHWDEFPHPSTYEEWRAEVEKLNLVEIDSGWPQYIIEHLQELIDDDLVDAP